MEVTMWLHKRAKLFPAKLISLKYHKIDEKHHKRFSRHLIFWKMVQCARSTHSTTGVSNFNSCPHTSVQDNHLLMLCGQLAIPLLPSSLPSLSLLALSRISTAKRSRRCRARAQAIRTWDDQYWWLFPLPSPKGVSWTVTCSSVKMISLPAVPQAQVTSQFHGCSSSWQANSVKCSESCQNCYPA